jgi:hypothetical protein
MAKRGRRIQHRYTKKQLTLDQVIKTTASFALVFDALQEIVAEKAKVEKQLVKLTKERDELQEKLAALPVIDENQMKNLARDLALNVVRGAMENVSKDLKGLTAAAA